MLHDVRLAVLILLWLCGTTASMAVAASGSLPDADGRAVIRYLNQSGYHSWQYWPGKEPFYPGRFPHGSLLTTYVSAGSYRAIKAKAGSIPAGEFVVKENFNAEKQLIAVSVMYKLAGYNAAGGDWFWLKYLPEGKIEEEGKVGGCIGCHAAVKNNDWLFIGPLE